MKMLTVDQIDALLELIEFHDDWDEVSEHVGVNVAELYDTLSDIQNELVTVGQVSTI